MEKSYKNAHTNEAEKRCKPINVELKYMRKHV